MAHYDYLVIGGGMTADAAVRGIRQLDGGGTIGIFCGEDVPPYDRPPLSKGLWQGDPVDGIWRGTQDIGGVELHLGVRARALDLQGRRVTDERGQEHTFGKLLLATGGTPRRLPSGGDEGVIYFRTFADYERLRDLAERGERFVVIGGGFIGSEIAAALAMNDRRVTMVFPEDGIGARTFPSELSGFLNDYYREKGVEVLAGQTVEGIGDRGGRKVVRTSDGREIEADGVVAGLGIRPETSLAEAAGLEVDDGIVVDEHLLTGAPDVYAAGDVARFYNPALGSRLRVEHEDNANTMGQQAGRNMAGAGEPYHHLPFFYSDLFELGYEAVGEIDSTLETVSDWKEPGREGVVYYLRDGRVRGVLLWNVWDQVENARTLIAEKGPFSADDLRGRLPEG
ncbi:MAG: FAD-dependent oxidoreductase [Rubrobacteraceae bacterium]|nr:FAD-dependent oxidoreductase [Rubrobacteraceae bacterium]